MFDPVEVVTRSGGICDGRSLREVCGDEEVRRAVRDERIVRVARNRYVLPGGPEALAAAARLTGTVSHLSAALHWGWKVRKPPRTPQVSVPPTRNLGRERRAGADVTWQHLSEQHRTAPGVTTRPRTVADCARHLDFPDALAVADSALRDGQVSREQIATALVQSPRIGQPQARRVLAEADPRSVGSTSPTRGWGSSSKPTPTPGMAALASSAMTSAATLRWCAQAGPSCESAGRTR